LFAVFDEFVQVFSSLSEISQAAIVREWIKRAGVHDGSNFKLPIPPHGSNPLHFFFAGVTGGAVSKVVTAPLERLKIIFQTRPPNSSGSMISTLSKIIHQEGFKGLFKGNGKCLFLSLFFF